VEATVVADTEEEDTEEEDTEDMGVEDGGEEEAGEDMADTTGEVGVGQPTGLLHILYQKIVPIFMPEMEKVGH